MADKVVPVDVRALVVAWPDDAPRGAVTRFVEEHGVSRSWFYEVRARARSETAVEAMQPRKRVPPARHAQAISVEVEDLAVRIRKELADSGWDHGPVTVRHKLLELGVAAPAASTLARVFTRRGMVVAQPRKRPRSSYRRFEFAMVHECWQLDAFQWALADQSACTIFQLLDDRSRYLLASHVAPGERAADALHVVRTGIERFQVPCLLLSDNGTAFNQTRMGRRSQLVDYLEALGTHPITGRPRHPQTQGKDERVHATLQRWLRKQPRARTLGELQAQVDTFDDIYNNARAHQSLGMRTPAQVLSAGPVAIPPLPPQPPTSPTPATRMLHRDVDNRGVISVHAVQIMLGWQHIGTHVTVLTSAQTLNIFDAQGTHISTVTLTPGKAYYGNGQPRGGAPRRKRPD